MAGIISQVLLTLSRILSFTQHSVVYENTALQAKARTFVPLSVLQARASKRLSRQRNTKREFDFHKLTAGCSYHRGMLSAALSATTSFTIYALCILLVAANYQLFVYFLGVYYLGGVMLKKRAV